MSAWQQWLQHPERSRVRKAVFHVHLYVGAALSLYVVLMSLTGSIIVFRDQLSRWLSVEWIVNLHEDLLFGDRGRIVTGIGAICLTTVCLTGAIVWWPGVKNWRRGATISSISNVSRFNWDAHSALGFWCFCFILMWGISGIYLSFPDAFNAPAFFLDPHDKYADRILSVLANLHFGRFRWYTKALWSIVGLVPASLAATGVFICCHRLIHHRSSNPHNPVSLDIKSGQ